MVASCGPNAKGGAIFFLCRVGTPGSMDSLFSDFFTDFWPGFLALDRRTGEGGSGVGRRPPLKKQTNSYKNVCICVY